MIAIAFLFVCALCDCFKSRWRLEAEILVLRHQLNVLQQRAPRRLHLRLAKYAIHYNEVRTRVSLGKDALRFGRCCASDPWRATSSVRANLDFGKRQNQHGPPFSGSPPTNIYVWLLRRAIRSRLLEDFRQAASARHRLAVSPSPMRPSGERLFRAS